MKPILAAALAATVLLAACDRTPQPRTAPGASSSGSGPSAPVQPTPQTGAPTAGEKKEGSNTVQGQVDPKQSAQHKDFEQPGDKAGPKQ
jgi:hypothetical protein